MNSGIEWECPAATIQYRLNLASVLHSISPALSALHASRAATLDPETSASLRHSHCPKCGTYYFSGDHPTHLVVPSTKRKRRCTTSSRQKILQRKCHRCGFSIDARASPSLSSPSRLLQVPDDLSTTGSATAIPDPNETGQGSRPVIDVSHPVTGNVAPVPPLSGRQSHVKPSHSLKTSTLKDMLARDRQREDAKAQKKRKEGHDGLAAFLKGL